MRSRSNMMGGYSKLSLLSSFSHENARKLGREMPIRKPRRAHKAKVKMLAVYKAEGGMKQRLEVYASGAIDLVI